jgi:tRNA pseudouridine13 synthase
MYTIKQRADDFIVDEIFSPDLLENGEYVYFRLKKTNYNTIDAISGIAEKIRIPSKRFGFAGAKDKKAVTSQIVSVKTGDNSKIQKLAQLQIRDIEIKILGKSDKPVSLGDHEGNEFTVVVRNLENFPEKISTRFINYFGPQRFGEKNSEIGLAILKKDFRKAAELIDRDEIKEYLQNHANDFIGAIMQLPRKLISLFIHAYQSDIWNRIVEKAEIGELSTPGFDSEYGEAEELVKKELEKDGITQRDFIVRQMPNMHTEGRLRKKWIEAEDFEILEKANDELNPGKRKMKLKFILQKGSYATVFIDSIFSSND